MQYGLWLYFGKQDPGAMSSTSFVYSSKMDTDETAYESPMTTEDS